MDTPPEDPRQPTTAAPGPTWKSHPEFRRLRVRTRLLGAAGLLLAVLFVIASVIQAQSNAMLRARLSALEAALRVAQLKNELLRREVKPENPIPSDPSRGAPLLKEPAPVPRETSPGEPVSP